MLSLEKCREILGEDAPLDESQLEARREEAYLLAQLLIEIFRTQKAAKRHPSGPLTEPEKWYK